jgi:hypothetical protein
MQDTQHQSSYVGPMLTQREALNTPLKEERSMKEKLHDSALSRRHGKFAPNLSAQLCMM